MVRISDIDRAVSAGSKPAGEPAAGPAGSSLSVGADVAVLSSRGEWHLGWIESAEAGVFTVRCADGSAMSAGPDNLRLLPAAGLKPGDKILAVWKNDTVFSTDSVKEIRGIEAVVERDDGTAPSPVVITRDSRGSVLADGGEIASEGRIYKGGIAVGSVERSGALWRGSHHAGDIWSGNIALECFTVGSYAPSSLDWDTLREVAAVLVFFVPECGF